VKRYAAIHILKMKQFLTQKPCSRLDWRCRTGSVWPCSKPESQSRRSKAQSGAEINSE